MLCGAMMLSTGTTAFAADSSISGSGQTGSADVTGTYQQKTPDKVYNVNLTWGSMAFTYQDKEKVWNPADQKYEDKEGSEAYWTCEKDANKVTVENRSNAAVEAHLSFTAEGESGITGQFSSASLTNSNEATIELFGDILELADRSVTPAPQEAEYKKSAWLMLKNGSLTSSDTNKKVGTVTVTISKGNVTDVGLKP